MLKGALLWAQPALQGTCIGRSPVVLAYPSESGVDPDFSFQDTELAGNPHFRLIKAVLSHAHTFQHTMKISMLSHLFSY